MKSNIERIKSHTDLPLAAGFGIKTRADVERFAAVADAVVVGSAIVETVQRSLDDEKQATQGTVEAVLNLVKDLTAGVRG